MTSHRKRRRTTVVTLVLIASVWFLSDGILLYGDRIYQTEGAYEDEALIYQAYHSLPQFDQYYPVIGSWIIGNESAGIGIREDQSPVTQDSSLFVPHYFT